MSVWRLTQSFSAAAFSSLLVLASSNLPAADPHPPEALEIGRLAPDIEGEDVDGVKFKLSDYRGKVVVLDFWGDW